MNANGFGFDVNRLANLACLVREALLMGHATMENRHGLAVAGMVTHTSGTAERRASEILLKSRSKAAG